MEKTIGILGGMGPEATLDLFGKIIAATPAARDQEHLRVVIDSNPKVPDRTAAILAGGESPVPAMTAGLRALQAPGRTSWSSPACRPTHSSTSCRRPGCRSCPCSRPPWPTSAERHPAIRTVGLLATTGTLRAGRFAADLGRAGIRVLEPEAADQERIMAAIYAIKGASRPRAEIAADVRAVARAPRSPAAPRGSSRAAPSCRSCCAPGSWRCPCSTRCRSWRARRSPRAGVTPKTTE